VGGTAESLRALLVGASISTFEYWSEFILRIQRNDGGTRPVALGRSTALRVPPVFCLRLRNTWWVGDRLQWEHMAEGFPIKSPPDFPRETTLQASIVTHLLSSTITDLRIGDLGDLEIILSSGDKLHVAGAGGKWDEAWIIELPPDDPDRERWSVVCGSDGTVYARWPLAGGPP